MKKQFGSRNALRGVTLIELLVAVGVTALLVGLMLGIVINITKGWNRSAGSLESGNQARLVLDQITSDLQAAILRRDGNVWMAATVQTAGNADWTAGTGANTLVIPTAVPPKLENYRFGPYGVWFRFFSTVPGTNVANDLTTLSAPRAVAYQIVRLPVVAGSTEIRYQLFRSEVTPDVTFRVGYNLLDAKYVSTDDGGSLTVRQPSRANLIGNNVVDFGVRIYEGATIKFPLGATPPPYAATSATVTSVPALAGYTTGVPDSVEVFVRILSNEGAQQLALFQNPPSGYTAPAGTTWWDIVEANSRVYTRRVDLKAKGL